MQEAILMGIDLGAGSLKVTIIASNGRELGSASSGVRTSILHPGWAEQDPEDWFRALCISVPNALFAAQLAAEDISAVSFSAGAHTPVLLDGDDNVIRPAILWSDQRSGAQSRELAEKAGGMIHRIGLNAPNPTWTLPQLAWLQHHEPDAISRVSRLLVAKDYLRFRLCGQWHTDRIDAVGTLLSDAKAAAWSPQICELIEWNQETLPPIVEPTAVVGTVTGLGAEASGLAAGTPVVAGTMDTAVECYGAGAVDPGQGVIKLATAGTVSVVTNSLQAHSEVIDYPHVIPGYAYAITGTNSCASAHRWLKDQFFALPSGQDGADGERDPFDAMDRLASQVQPGSDGMIFHPYLQGERSPYWDEFLRADFIGVTMSHTAAHFVRALYEGVAFSLRDCIGSLNAQGLSLQGVRLVGGGAKSATWRQVVCDVIGMPVDVPGNGDASFGAALVAGVGIGVFSDERDAVTACVRLVDHHEPVASHHERYRELFSIYKDSQAALVDINHRISHLMNQRN